MVQKAVVVTAPKVAELVTDRPIPALRDDYILVKVVSVALNPTDWKHVDFLTPPGALIGCDYAGIVEEVGKDVKKPFKKGDRICGFVHGGNAVQFEDGAFAEYIVAKGDVQTKIPDNMSFQEAATLGVGIATVGQAVYFSLGLNSPYNPISEPVPILIYGGSTATGTLAIQFAKLSGYQVLTTCSSHNFDLVKSLGADAVFDYKKPNAAEEIRNFTGNKLKLVFDTISLEQSAKFCAEAISTEGGEYGALLSVKFPREDVKTKFTLAYSTLGEAYDFGPQSFPESPEDLAFAKEWWKTAENFLAEGKVKVHPLSVGKDGLKGVLEGLDLMRKDQVSGKKLVYNVSETP
jgi:NADPH:quinone reductase-like Zn-dependent oxidoreductase